MQKLVSHTPDLYFGKFLSDNSIFMRGHNNLSD
jgi:hypothetical protein